jgi:alkaline phosphatase D
LKKTILPFLLLFSFYIAAQPRVISGPMLGQIELRDAKVWVEVSPEVKSVSLQYYKKGEATKSKTILYKGELGNDLIQ